MCVLGPKAPAGFDKSLRNGNGRAFIGRPQMNDMKCTARWICYARLCVSCQTRMQGSVAPLMTTRPASSVPTCILDEGVGLRPPLQIGCTAPTNAMYNRFGCMGHMKWKTGIRWRWRRETVEAQRPQTNAQGAAQGQVPGKNGPRPIIPALSRHLFSLTLTVLAQNGRGMGGNNTCKAESGATARPKPS